MNIQNLNAEQALEVAAKFGKVFLVSDSETLRSPSEDKFVTWWRAWMELFVVGEGIKVELRSKHSTHTTPLAALHDLLERIGETLESMGKQSDRLKSLADSSSNKD